MTSSSKKKKQKKASFQKVKLKVGKKIPKGNVVDTTFKAKKIMIKEQLKTDVQQKSGKVKKDIKEYLSKLQHYNATVRLDALKNLKESLTAFSELVTSHLHSLIEKVSVLMTDLHSAVRKFTTNLLKLIFSKIQPDQIVPFLPVIVAHLRCAMTHITYEIQSDSLNIVDLLIDSFPQHLKHFSQCFFHDFLNQISSRVKSFSNSSSGHHSCNNRTLAHDPACKVTSLSWYLQVTHRLKKFLKTVFDNYDSVSTVQDNNSSIVVRWNGENPLYVPLYGRRLCINSELSICENYQSKDFFGDGTQFQTVLSSLMPLLFEIWVEASSLNEDVARNQLCDEPLQIYMCLIEIIALLWKIIEKWQSEESHLYLEEWFIGKFGDSFISYCMAWFPYEEQFKFPPKNKGKAETVANTVQLNLLLCDIVIRVSSVRQSDENKYLGLARNYIMEILSDGRQLNSFNTEVIIEIMKRLLLKDVWQENQKLLECVTLGIQHLNPTSSYMKHFLNLLNYLIQEKKYSHLYKLSAFTLWLAWLPEQLLKCNVIPIQLLDVIKRAIHQGQAEVLDNLRLHLSKAFAKLPELKVDGGSVVDAQKHIIDMLYWIPSIDMSFFTLLAKLCIDAEINTNLSAYIVQVLNNRYRRQDSSTWCGGSVHYFSFLLSLILGSSKAELEDVENSVEFINDYNFFAYLEFERKPRIVIDTKERILHQRDLSVIGIVAMQLIAGDAYVRNMVKEFLCQLFTDFQSLPLRCVYSILLLMSRLWHVTVPPQNLLSSLVSMILSTLEIAVVVDELSSVLLPLVNETMIVPGLLDCVCNQLHTLSLKCMTSDTVNVFGEVLLAVLKSSQSVHAEQFRSVLDELQVKHADSVTTAQWFIKAKYELHIRYNV